MLLMMITAVDQPYIVYYSANLFLCMALRCDVIAAPLKSYTSPP